MSLPTFSQVQLPSAHMLKARRFCMHAPPVTQSAQVSKLGMPRILRVGYYVPLNNTVEMDFKAVAENYLTGWFVIDALAALPREVFGVAQNSSAKSTRMLLVGLHSIKYAKVGQFIKRLHINMDIELSPFTFNVLCWCGTLLTWLHYVTCITAWVWMASENDEYLSIELDGKEIVFEDGICGDAKSKSDCVARYYLRAFRTAIAYLESHGQVRSCIAVEQGATQRSRLKSEAVHGSCADANEQRDVRCSSRERLGGRSL